MCLRRVGPHFCAGPYTSACAESPALSVVDRSIPQEGAVSKSSTWPETRTVNPVPDVGTQDWVIWAAWADRITFEEIRQVTGLTEAEVIRLMRRSLKRKRFERWRARATHRSLKHRRRFQARREVLKSWDLDDE